MLDYLKIKEGNPICLIFDHQFDQQVTQTLPVCHSLTLTYDRVEKLTVKPKAYLRQKKNFQNETELIYHYVREGLQRYHFINTEEELALVVKDHLVYLRVD